MTTKGWSTRRFTKRMTVANMIAAWVSIGMVIWTGVGIEVVVPTMSAFVVGLYVGYTGIGHLDYRAFARTHPYEREDGHGGRAGRG